MTSAALKLTPQESAQVLGAHVRCVGYVRVSTERQAGEQYTSLADQRKAIEALAERLKVRVGEWFRDEGASGATVTGRPAFRAMLDACEANPRRMDSPGLVLVLNDSRFGRFPDPDEAAALRFRFKQSGWIVRFAEGDETEDITFRSVIRSLGSAQASEYRRNLQRNSRRGMRGAAEQGYWTRRAPFGYRRIVVYPPEARRVLEPTAHKSDKEKVSLTPDEREAGIVRWMFETYASGRASLYDLARELTTMVPERKWGGQVIRVMLMNPTYLGDVVAGRRPASRIERRLWSPAPRGEWYGKRGAHPAIVDRAIFDRVQARLEENRRLRRGVDHRAHYVLTGLIRCPYCGSHYVGGGGGRSKSDPSKPRRIYRCGTVGRTGEYRTACPGTIGTITQHILESAVIDTLSGVIGSPRMRTVISRELDRVMDEIANGSPASRTRSKDAERTLVARRERLVARISDGTLTREEAASQLAQIRDALARIEAEREEDRVRQARRAVIGEERDRLLELVLDFPAQARRLGGVELRELIRPWLAGATFDKETRVLTLEIRRIPQAGCFRPESPPGQTCHEQAGVRGCERVITRRVHLGQPGPDARRAKARARAAAQVAS